MKLALISCAFLFCTFAPTSFAGQAETQQQTSPAPATAQTTPATQPSDAQANSQTPVTLDKEPHHHLVLQNGYVRVYRLGVLSPESTLLHRHENPYIYMSVGATQFTNAVAGQPDVEVKVKDGQLGYSKGDFAHIIKTQRDTPVYNITIEFLHPQGAVSSQCPQAAKNPLSGCTAPEDAVAAANAKIDTQNKMAAPSSSPGTGSNTPIGQADAGLGTDEKASKADPPSLSAIMESDEVSLRFANFNPKSRTALPAGPAGTLVVVEPLSQFKLDFADGSEQLLSGGDAFWLQPNTNTTIINSSDQIASSLLIFTFKDAPAKPAGKN